jgi:hypothetical protein
MPSTARARDRSPRRDDRSVGAEDASCTALRRDASGGTVVKRRGPRVDLHEVSHDEAHERLRDAVERRHDDERDVFAPGVGHRARNSSTCVVNGQW